MISAAMVTPNMTLGGAERWVTDMVKHSDPKRLRWTGVAISSFGGLDAGLALELKSHTKLVTNGLYHRPEVCRPFAWDAIDAITGPDFRQTIRRAAEGAQAIVTWGQTDMGYWLDEFDVPRVNCSHTSLSDAIAPGPISGTTHLVAVSERALCFFDGRPGVEGLPRRVIYNGADPARCYKRIGRQAQRQKWGIPYGEVVIGYLGRQSPEKNPLAPAKAVWATRNRRPAWHAVYYGPGPAGRGPCPETHAWCEEHIPGRYRMYPPETHIGDILRGFDCLVLASHREAFSLTLIEAWLAGTPVVATPVGSVEELEAKFGRLVFRVPVDPSPEQLAEAVAQATDPVESGPIVKHARQVARENFTVQAMLQRWTDFLEEIV